MYRNATVAATLVVLALMAPCGYSAPLPYVGFDPGALPGPGTHPVSDAALAAWMADPVVASATSSLVDFEPFPLGSYAPVMLLAPGVTLTAPAGCPLDVMNTPSESIANGYNITPGGSQRLSLVRAYITGPLTYTFNFATPISAFSLYIDGEGNTVGSGAMLSLDFTDSSGPQTVGLPATMGCRFGGFTDAGENVYSVDLTFGAVQTFSQPFVSLDDIRWVYAPEPTSLAGLGLVGLLVLARRDSHRL